MDQNNLNSNQTPPIQPQPVPAKPAAGPITGIIIIIVVLIIGALYFYGAQLNYQPTPETETVGTETSALSISDEIDAIASDLSATVINSTDADISEIEAQINQ